MTRSTTQALTLAAPACWPNAAIALAVAAATLGGPAHAAPATARDPRPLEARKACAAGNVERGIEILAEIIVENGDPNAIYNQARCYQQNGRAEQAVPRFREYLRVAKGITASERTQVEGYIRELETEVEAQRVRRAAAPTADPFPTTAAEPAPTTPVKAAEPASALRPLRVAGYLAAGAGVAALGAGAYFGWRTQNTARTIEQHAAPAAPAEIARLMDQGRRDEALQWVGYGVGATALLGSAALFYFSRPLELGTTQVAVAPSLIRGGGGAQLVAAF